MSRLLMIGAGWEQEALLREAKNKGHFVVATHPSLDNSCLQLADRYFIRDARDIDYHSRLASNYKIDGILTDNCDYSYYTACLLNEKFGFKKKVLRSAILSNNKLQQRLTCSLKAIQQPKYFSVKTIDDLSAATSKLGFPIILKPIDNRGTFGITIIRKEQDLESAFYEAIANSMSRELICEEFIEGNLITVDGFCFKNGHKALAVASRKFAEGSKPITKEIVYPALLTDKVISKLMSNHEKVVEALNYTEGHTHGEYIISVSGEVFLVECTNRGGGVYTSSTIVPYVSTLNLNAILINQVLNTDNYSHQLGTEYKMTNSVILSFIDFEPEKVIKRINLKELLDLEFVLKFRTIYGKNQMVESIENCASRHSMLVITGENTTAAKKNLAYFKSTIKIEYY